MTETTELPFQIGADGVDAGAIVENIKARVAEKTRQGLYDDSCVARAERTTLRALADDSRFVEFYFEQLRDSVFVDINDFPIYERRRVLTRLLVLLKQAVWKLLRFYTYRMWSQQNEINGLLLSATEAVDGKNSEKMRDMETRLAKLEEQARQNADHASLFKA